MVEARSSCNKKPLPVAIRFFTLPPPYKQIRLILNGNLHCCHCLESWQFCPPLSWEESISPAAETDSPCPSAPGGTEYVNAL